jgi:hypothetical protein
LRLLTFDRYRRSTLLSNYQDKTLAAGDAGINQIPLEHHVVLLGDGNHYDWIFRPLRLADGRRVIQHQFIQFAKRLGDDVLIESGRHFLLVLVDMGHKRDVAVIDVLVIVVLDLHDIVGHAGKCWQVELNAWLALLVLMPQAA